MLINVVLASSSEHDKTRKLTHSSMSECDSAEIK